MHCSHHIILPGTSETWMRVLDFLSHRLGSKIFFLKNKTKNFFRSQIPSYSLPIFCFYSQQNFLICLWLLSSLTFTLLIPSATLSFKATISSLHGDYICQGHHLSRSPGTPFFQVFCGLSAAFRRADHTFLF